MPFQTSNLRSLGFITIFSPPQTGHFCLPACPLPQHYLHFISISLTVSLTLTFRIIFPDPPHIEQVCKVPETSPLPLQCLQIYPLLKLQTVQPPLQNIDKGMLIQVLKSPPLGFGLFYISAKPSQPNKSQVFLLDTSINTSQALLIQRYFLCKAQSPAFLSGWYFTDSFLKAFFIQSLVASVVTQSKSYRLSCYLDYQASTKQRKKKIAKTKNSRIFIIIQIYRLYMKIFMCWATRTKHKIKRKVIKNRQFKLQLIFELKMHSKMFKFGFVQNVQILIRPKNTKIQRFYKEKVKFTKYINLNTQMSDQQENLTTKGNPEEIQEPKQDPIQQQNASQLSEKDQNNDKGDQEQVHMVAQEKYRSQYQQNEDNKSQQLQQEQGQVSEKQYPIHQRIQEQNGGVQKSNNTNKDAYIANEEAHITNKDANISNKDEYINKLQIQMSKVRCEFLQKTKVCQEISQQNKKTKQTLKKTRFELLSCKQQASNLNEQNMRIQRQKLELEGSNKCLQAQISVFREAGDINFYKSKIVEQQNLIKIQKQQLQMKKQMIDEQQELKLSIGETTKSKVQILSLIQKYECQNRVLDQKQIEISLINKQLQNQTQRLELQNSQLKLDYERILNEAIAHKQIIMRLQQKSRAQETQFNRKMKQMEQALTNSINNPNRQQISEQKTHALSKNAQEKYGIKVMSLFDQRNLILKQYIELEVKYQSAVQELSTVRDRHYNVLKQLKNVSTTHIPKKDYSQLYKRYAKLRKCLQNSLINQEKLKRQLANYDRNPSLDPVNKQNSSNVDSSLSRKSKSDYISLLLQEPQNQIQKVQKIIQSSSESHKQLFTIKQQLQTKQKIIKSQKLLKQKQQRICQLETETHNLKSLIQLYDQELIFKNSQIELLRKTNQQNLDAIFHLQKNFISKEYQQMILGEIQEKRTLIQILQIKNMQAIKQNNILKNQKKLLAELYDNLKSMYEEVLNRQPQSQFQDLRRLTQNQKNAPITEKQQKPCKQCLQRTEKLKNFKTSESQIQTQGLGELYFKQIKELLTVLRKFPKKVDSITGILESQKSSINQIKKKYDNAIEAYGVKSKHLEEEKKGNEQWRSKQKQQIREQFQQIRDLLLNERLLSALRKAKSLIQYYEQANPQAEQNLEDGQEGQLNQKVQGARQQPIEQEKQNA